MRKRSTILALLFTIYVVSYLLFRTANTEIWKEDGNAYVIFPKDQSWIYYLYRPLTYIDSKATSMHFHVGPHA